MAKYKNIPSPVNDPRYFECLSWERQQIKFLGVWVYREFQERQDNPEYSFYCADGYWATETLEEMEAQIDKSFEHKRTQQNKDAELRQEIAQEESKFNSKISSKFTITNLIYAFSCGLAGFTIAGGAGLILGIAVGSAAAATLND